MEALESELFTGDASKNNHSPGNVGVSHTDCYPHCAMVLAADSNHINTA